jgi:hypothetical protein
LSIPSSVEFVGQRCFEGCHSLSGITFCLPSHVRELLDVAGEVVDIPDSVEQVAFSNMKGFRRKTLNFGHESKLDGIELSWGYSRIDALNQGFLRFSTRTLKTFRSQYEFAL